MKFGLSGTGWLLALSCAGLGISYLHSDRLARWWVPTSDAAMEAAEARLLEPHIVRTSVFHRFVAAGSQIIHSLHIPQRTRHHQHAHVPQAASGDAGLAVDAAAAMKPPMVMLHGFGGSGAVFCKNFYALSEHYTLYTIDIPGFGRSSAPDFGSEISVQSVRNHWVHTVEAWRKEMGFEQIVLLGHSMGGYIAADYALTYPDRVSRLVLVSPFGFKPRIIETEGEVVGPMRSLPLYARVLMYVVTKVGVMSFVRAIGPLGPRLLSMRSAYDDGRYGFGDDRVSKYVYHLVAGFKDGDRAFLALSDTIGYAKEPLISRAHDLKMPLTLVYGEHDFMTPETGFEIKKRAPQAEMFIVPGAGHHPYATHSHLFHDAVLHHVRGPRHRHHIDSQQPLHYHPPAWVTTD